MNAAQQRAVYNVTNHLTEVIETNILKTKSPCSIVVY